MIRLLHIGALNGNLGDNIAVYNVRKSLKKVRKDIEFVTLNIHELWNRRNEPDYLIKIFNSSNVDGILIGGGGLLEYHSYTEMRTKQKLPLNKKVIEESKIPIFIYGIGINTFRNNGDWSEDAKEVAKYILENVDACSLRNDGSIQKAKKLGIYSNKLIEIPDPGLLHHQELPDKNTVARGLFQPAINSSKFLNRGRFLSFENYIKGIPNKLNLPIFPHTAKDFKFGGNFCISGKVFEDLSKFSKVEKAFDTYDNFDYIIAMRGHGQLVSIGKNLPGIYLSTQDKVTDFSHLNGFEKYNVDVTEKEWIKKFEDKVNKLRNDNNYLRDWYEIRHENMKKWHKQDTEFAFKCLIQLGIK